METPIQLSVASQKALQTIINLRKYPTGATAAAERNALRDLTAKELTKVVDILEGRQTFQEIETKRRRFEDAYRFLLDYLFQHPWPVPCKTIIAEAATYGHAEYTIRKAFAAMNGSSERENYESGQCGQTLWSHPTAVFFHSQKVANSEGVR